MHSSTNYAVVQYFRELMADRVIFREAHPITLDIFFGKFLKFISETNLSAFL